MEEQKFTIQNLVFDVDFSSREKTHELQNRISRLFTNRLSSLLEKAFHETIPVESILKFQTLRLELGTVAYNNLENELPEKLLEAVRNAFPDSLKQSWTNGSSLPGFSSEPSEKNFLHLLEYFLFKGFFPWWAPVDSVIQLQRKLMEAPGVEANQLHDLLMAAGQKEYIRKRLSYQFTEPFIHKIIGLLEPADAGFIIDYHSSIKTVHAQTPLIKSEAEIFYKEVWFFILTFLMVEKGSIFSRKEFIRSTLKKMAAHFSVAYEEVLLIFEQALDSYSLIGRKAELAQLIKLISEEQYTGSTQQRPVENDSAIVNKWLPGIEQIKWLQFFLDNGSLPPQAGIKSVRDMKTLLARLIEEFPVHVRKMMTALTGDLLAERIYRIGGREVIEMVLRLTRPSRITELISYLNALEEASQDYRSLGNSISMQPVLAILVNYAFLPGKYDPAAFIRYTITRLRKMEGVQISVLANLLIDKLEPDLSYAGRLKLLEERDLDEGDGLPADAKDLKALRLEKKNFSGHDLAGLLRHFIITGALPSWSAGKSISITKVLEILLTSSPEKAVQLFKWAGTERRYRERVLLHFPTVILYNIMRQFTAGNSAATAVHHLLQALKAGSFSFDDNASWIEIHILRAAWEQLIFEEYERFNEDLFQVVTAVQVAKLFKVAPDEALPLLINLANGYDLELFYKTLYGITHTGEKRRAAIPVLSFEALSEIASLQVSEPEMPAERAAHRQQLSELQKAVEYFFIHQSFPDRIKQRPGFSSLVFLKSALLVLFEVDVQLLKPVLLQHVSRPGVSALLRRLFSMDQEVDRSFLQWLTKLMDQPSAGIDDQAVTNEHAAQLSQQELLETIPLLHEHYLGDEPAPEHAVEVALRLVDIFLTWNELPLPRRAFKGSAVDEIVKEAVVFLYEFHRASLISLLQKEIHYSPARLRLTQMFRSAAGGKEALIAAFLQAYLKVALLDYLWEMESEISAVKDMNRQAISPIGISEEVTISEEQQIYEDRSVTKKEGSGVNETLHLPDPLNRVGEIPGQKAIEWLNYFLSHGRFPDGYRRPPGGLREWEMGVIRIAFVKEKVSLKNILSKETHNPDARIQLHEWLLAGQSFSDKELVGMVNQFLPGDILRYFEKHLDIAAKGSVMELFESVTRLEDVHKKKAFLQTAISRRVVIEHIVSQFETPAFWRFLDSFDEQLSKKAEAMSKELEKLFFPVLKSNYEQYLLNVIIKEFALLMVAGQLTIRNRVDFISRFFDHIESRRPVFLPGLYENLQRSLAENKDHPIAEDAALQRHVYQEIIKRKGRPVDSLITVKTQKGELEKIDQLPLKTEARGSDKPYEQPVEKGTKLYLTNAGLVLFHPFITTYFSLTGLVNGGRFINEAAPFRAVHLLQYLVHGNTAHEEQSLVLNKLLCGLPLEQPVQQAIILTDQEKNITAELFKVLFQRWEKMKNSSVEGFRHSFLQREGLLVRGEEGWTMKVEQKGYDLILQTLPWAIGLIKLPWMPRLLQVEWV